MKVVSRGPGILEKLPLFVLPNQYVLEDGGRFLFFPFLNGGTDKQSHRTKGYDRTSNDQHCVQRAGGSCEARMPGIVKKDREPQEEIIYLDESRTCR